jgi:hypothetical protein
LSPCLSPWPNVIEPPTTAITFMSVPLHFRATLSTYKLLPRSTLNEPGERAAHTQPAPRVGDRHVQPVCAPSLIECVKSRCDGAEVFWSFAWHYWGRWTCQAAQWGDSSRAGLAVAVAAAWEVHC